MGPTLGKTLILSGLALVLAGGLVLLLSRFGVARLPGDLVWRKGNFSLYAPFGWMLLLSLLLTLALNLFARR